VLGRILIVVCGLLVCHPGFAEWRIVTTKTTSNRALLQKEISTDFGNPIIAIVCTPEPTLIVQWFEKHNNVSISIDTVRLDVAKQVAMQNGNQALTLKAGHIQGLINGMELQLEAELPTGETVTAETSLRGFTSEYNRANMDCSV